MYDIIIYDNKSPSRFREMLSLPDRHAALLTSSVCIVWVCAPSRHSRLTVFLGAISALAVMTFLSA